MIRQVTDLPVVEIQLSVYDVLSAMKLAEKLFQTVRHRGLCQHHGDSPYPVRPAGQAGWIS